MKFRVIRQKTPSCAYSPIHVVEQATGQGIGWITSWIASMFAVLHTRACIAMHTACCTSCAGGRAFIIPAISPRQTLPNQPCSITCASSPAGNLRLLLLPSTIASLLQIVPFATSFLTLPVRWRTDFINPFCIAGQWA